VSDLTKPHVVPADELPLGEDAAAPAVGKWYWRLLLDENGKSYRKLVCVTAIGSNYVEVETPGRSSWRIHDDHFHLACTYEPNAALHIQSKVAEHTQRAVALMEEVKALAARLAIPAGLALAPATQETQALAVHGQSEDPKKYKKALVRARDKTFPELFKQIEKANEKIARWTGASLLPLKAQAGSLKKAMGAIENRIFNVELYAGLVEKLVEIKQGEPAGVEEKVHLFQRRAYMDEECLAEYETGGMTLESIGAFDAWLSRPEHLERLLPYPRTILAFQVRRFEKAREWSGSVEDLIQLWHEAQTDKLTYLYIRNGEQLFRLSTEIEFGEKLFPDMARHTLEGKLYAEMFADNVQKIIGQNEYESLLEAERAEDERLSKLPDEDQFFARRGSWSRVEEEYKPFDVSNVYYDDIAKFIRDQEDHHNRLVLILQGLLDRSPCLHPHPAWTLWSPKSFSEALELIYDDSRALVAGDKPDFEAYQKALNASLRAGSVCVGQMDFWLRQEAAKENEREDRRSRSGYSAYRRTHFHPYGNPGPGAIAKATRVSRDKSCTFQWKRPKASENWRSDAPATVGCALSVPSNRLLNVAAYRPGDFKRFFADPRTRAEYLKWAPLLLEAEECWAGNRALLPDGSPNPKKSVRTKQDKSRF